MPIPALLKRYRRQNRSLRRLAQREASNVESWGYRLRLSFTRATLPTIDALGVAVAYGVVALLLTYGSSLLARARLNNADARQVLLTLWEVQAAAAGVALPVLLFVIEVSRGGLAGGTRTHEVLLRRTLIFPILACATVGTILTGGYLIAAEPSVVLIPHFVFVFVATMLGTLYAFYQVVRLTFSESKLHEAAVALLREKMRLSVDASAVRRLANQLLLGRLLPSTELMTHNPFEPDDKENHVIVYARKPGTLADLDPILLEDLSRFFAVNQEMPDAARPTGDALTTDAPRESRTKRASVQWMRFIGDRIRDGKTPLLAFDRRNFPNLDVDTVHARVNQMITLAADDNSEALQNELGYLRDVVIQAIKEGNARQVENRLDLHEELIRAFLNSLTRWRAAYTPEATAREDTLPFRRFGWSELQWLEEDFREFAAVAVRQGDVKFARLVSGAAYSLALYAVGEAEYYVYSHAIDLMTYPYRAALVDPEQVPLSRASQIADYTAFMLREMCNLRLTFEIKDSFDPERLLFAKNSGVKVLRTLGLLAKEAGDTNRAVDFAAFTDALNMGFARVEERRRELDADDED